MGQYLAGAVAQKLVRKPGACALCGSWRENNHGYCNRCQAAYMREWRSRHPMTAEQRRRDSARSYAGVYLRRGKIQRSACVRCESSQSQMHHPDYTKPLEVVWLCRPCHLGLHRNPDLGDSDDAR